MLIVNETQSGYKVLQAIGLIISLVGLALLSAYSWKIGLGALLLIYGNNVQQLTFIFKRVREGDLH